MAHCKVAKNLSLVAGEVMPKLRGGRANVRAAAEQGEWAMTDFKRQTHTLNGVKTVVLTAGKGEPLVFWHGAGTFTGFDFAKPWAEKFRVLIPFHPGFGESGDDPAMTDPHDYVMHYLDLFAALDLA
jgi:hypothetical protein